MQKAFEIYMKHLLKNPLSVWFLWFFKSRILLYKHRNKNLAIGYLSSIINSKIGRYNTLYENVFIYNCEIDDYVYISSNSTLKNCKVGKFCSIGPNVQLGLGMHPTNYLSTFPAFFSVKKQCQISFVDENYFKELGNIKIGNDVWIGANSIIMDNITIGDGAIIAAGAVICKNVDPYSIVGGVPAKFIRKRFSEEKILELLELNWWNKDIIWIKNNIHLFKQEIH